MLRTIHGPALQKGIGQIVAKHVATSQPTFHREFRLHPSAIVIV